MSLIAVWTLMRFILPVGCQRLNGPALLITDWNLVFFQKGCFEEEVMTCGRLYSYCQENSVQGQKKFCLNSLFQFKAGALVSTDH